MIFFMQMSVIQLKRIVAIFTGLNKQLKGLKYLKYVNYVTYLQNPVTLIEGMHLTFVLLLGKLFIKVEKSDDKELTLL